LECQTKSREEDARRGNASHSLLPFRAANIVYGNILDYGAGTRHGLAVLPSLVRNSSREIQRSEHLRRGWRRRPEALPQTGGSFACLPHLATRQ
jgi:hypothetical protein